MKKRTARNTVLGIVVLCFMLTLCVFGTGIAAYAQQEEKLQKQEIEIAEELVPEQKLFSKATIEDNFDDSSVLVVMTKA